MRRPFDLRAILKNITAAAITLSECYGLGSNLYGTIAKRYPILFDVDAIAVAFVLVVSLAFLFIGPGFLFLAFFQPSILLVDLVQLFIEIGEDIWFLRWCLRSLLRDQLCFSL